MVTIDRGLLFVDIQWPMAMAIDYGHGHSLRFANQLAQSVRRIGWPIGHIGRTTMAMVSGCGHGQGQWPWHCKKMDLFLNTWMAQRCGRACFRCKLDRRAGRGNRLAKLVGQIGSPISWLIRYPESAGHTDRIDRTPMAMGSGCGHMAMVNGHGTKQKIK